MRMLKGLEDVDWALEAGLESGGEEGPVHSAALIVSHEQAFPLVSLRVDWDDENPIRVLRRLWEDYKPQMGAKIKAQPPVVKVAWNDPQERVLRWSLGLAEGPPRQAKVAVLFGMGLNAAAVLIDNLILHRYPRIRDALRIALREDSRVVVLGEDVGKVGGVFRVTEGLHKRFGGKRVMRAAHVAL